MKTVAVIVHWGPVEPTTLLASSLVASASVDEVLVVANDLRPPPAGIGAVVTWLVPPRNLGFGGGADLACSERPGASYYLFLNNDVRLDDDVTRACLDRFADDRVGVVGPTLVNVAGLQSGIGRLSVLAEPHVDRAAAAGGSDADWVTGACMFVRAECYQQVRMDGRYFLGFEDTDFCVRARRAGWRVLSVPERAWHESGTTIPAGRYVYYIVRNRLWFVRLHGPAVQLAAVVLWAAAWLVPRVLLADLLRRRGTVSSRLAGRGLLDGLRRMPPAGQPFPDEPRPARWASW